MVADFFSLHKRRDRSLIIAKILDVAREGALKTQIMYRVSLSFAQLKEYLSLLLDLNLLEAIEASEKNIYKTTEKGFQYLRGFRKLRELLVEGKGKNTRQGDSLHLVKRGTRVILL